ncbi:M18 family aminopeptidase [Stomatobaculum longum]|uniref:M18 family aminopeptidase n=1 Tax=Stomatobaculum longum TaxID=796942 RepID=UPI0028F08F73|nr:M18 family aminopeptidase [Stomatobaculum longum]
MKREIEALLGLIQESPTAFQAVAALKRRLLAAGYTELREAEPWTLCRNGKYFTTRNGSALIAFRLPAGEADSFQIIASHSDSPSFKIKENPDMEVEGHYVKLNVERYGGMLCAPWFDRPLSVAGRIAVQRGNEIRTELVCIDRDLLMIPNLAIHMNHEANKGYEYNAQRDMLPLWRDGNSKKKFMDCIAEEAGVAPEQIVGADLFLYNRMPGTVWGEGDCYFSAPRLDDLECAAASLEGFLQAKESKGTPVFALFDNEEVGSGTKQGAASTFLTDVLLRLFLEQGKSRADYLRAIANSFMISADNAHAVHPNYADKHDPSNRVYMNSGVVVKHSANQHYTTDAVSDAVFRYLAAKAEVSLQHFHNRSDVAGGSTLGNISGNQVALATVDIGLAQLAMHSPYETAGCSDYLDFIRIARCFYGLRTEARDGGFAFSE